MKIKVKEKLVISKEMLELALDIPISDLTFENDCFRIVTKKGSSTTGHKEVITYLRCADLNCSYVYDNVMNDSIAIEGNRDDRIITIFYLENCLGGDNYGR